MNRILWGAAAAEPPSRTCARCTQRHVNGFVAAANRRRRFLCRRCYETLPYTRRILFDVSFGRAPVFDDYWTLRLSVRELYGGARVYALIWALRSRRLPPELVRAIVEAPLARVETPSTRATTLFGRAHGLRASNVDGLQHCELFWHGRAYALTLLWRNERFYSLVEYSPDGEHDGFTLYMDTRGGAVSVFDEYTHGQRRIGRRRFYDEEASGYLTRRIVWMR